MPFRARSLLMNSKTCGAAGPSKPVRRLPMHSSQAFQFLILSSLKATVNGSWGRMRSSLKNLELISPIICSGVCADGTLRSKNPKMWWLFKTVKCTNHNLCVWGKKGKPNKYPTTVLWNTFEWVIQSVLKGIQTTGPHPSGFWMNKGTSYLS